MHEVIEAEKPTMAARIERLKNVKEIRAQQKRDDADKPKGPTPLAKNSNLIDITEQVEGAT